MSESEAVVPARGVFALMFVCLEICMALAVGAVAPSFSLADQSGTQRSLAEYAGKHVVMYFYPKDDTSVCTKEACSFNDTLPQFEAAGVPVMGVSPDSVKSHAKFAAKYKLTFPLLADVAEEGSAPAVCEAFGVWVEKSMYGRKYMGVERTTFLIGPDGKIARVWEKVKVDGHVEEVLAAIHGKGGGDASDASGAASAMKSGTKKVTAKKAAKKAAGAAKVTKKADGKAAAKAKAGATKGRSGRASPSPRTKAGSTTRSSKAKAKAKR
jgi:thioredoxin-dependent peroxiredoxin